MPRFVQAFLKKNGGLFYIFKRLSSKVAHKNAIYDSTTRSITMPYQNKELLPTLAAATQKVADLSCTSTAPLRFDFEIFSSDNPSFTSIPEIQILCEQGLTFDAIRRVVIMRLGGNNLHHKYEENKHVKQS